MSLQPTNPGRVLITGGASGLGAAVAEAVRDNGGTPIVLDRDISTLTGVTASVTAAVSATSTS